MRQTPHEVRVGLGCQLGLLGKPRTLCQLQLRLHACINCSLRLHLAGWSSHLQLMLLSLACKISCHPIITHCSLQPSWQACHGCSCGAFNNQSDTTPCAAVQQRRHSVRKNARHSCVCERHTWVSRFRWLRQHNKQLTAALLRPRCKFTMHTPSAQTQW